jgi:hypothetical protein
VGVKIFGAGLALLLVLVTPARTQEVPKWLADAKARESRLAGLVDVASEDGWLRTRVPGTVKHKVVLEDGSYDVDITVDGTLTVSCVVMREPRDLSAFLARSAEVAFKEIEKVNGTVEAREVEFSDAGSIGPHPFMSLLWLYRANRGGDKRVVGGLKQYIAALDGAVVYCTNDELGYAKTFESVTRTLTTHFRTSGESAPKPYFREVSVVSVDGKRAGVGTTTMTKDAEGDTKVVNTSALLLQAAPGKLISMDASDVQWVRPDGSLINALLVKSSNGELSEDMAVKSSGDRWQASGKISGKQVDVDLPGAPSSYVTQAHARRRLMAQANPVGASTDSMIWSPLDLTRLLPTRATVLAPVSADRYSVREELGGVAMEAVLDKQTGTIASSKILLGPRTMHVERIYRDGDF